VPVEVGLRGSEEELIVEILVLSVVVIVLEVCLTKELEVDGGGVVDIEKLPKHATI
jgi:hypothetical protein